MIQFKEDKYRIFWGIAGVQNDDRYGSKTADNWNKWNCNHHRSFQLAFGCISFQLLLSVLLQVFAWLLHVLHDYCRYLLDSCCKGGYFPYKSWTRPTKDIKDPDYSMLAVVASLALILLQSVKTSSHASWGSLARMPHRWERLTLGVTGLSLKALIFFGRVWFIAGRPFF